MFVFAVLQQNLEDERKRKNEAEESLKKSAETTKKLSLQIEKLQRDRQTEKVKSNVFFVIKESITDSKLNNYLVTRIFYTWRCQ